MLKSKLFLKTISVIIIFISSYILFISFFIIPKVDQNTIKLEEKNAQTTLEKIVNIINKGYEDLVLYEKNALLRSEKQLRNLTNTVLSVIDIQYEKDTNSKEKALKLIKQIKYDTDNYFFALDYNNILISHPFIEGKDITKIKEDENNEKIKQMIKRARKEGENFSSYKWYKDYKDDHLYSKLTYIKNYPKWEMFVGTGIYIDDINKEINKRGDELFTQLAKIIKTTKVSKNGYLYIFNSKGEIVISPPNQELENLKSIQNGKIFNEIVKLSKNEEKKGFYYTVKENGTVYEKVAWCTYIPSLDWYLTSTAYIEDFKESSKSLINYILILSSILIIFSLIISYLYLKKLFSPISKLTEIANSVEKGDYSVDFNINTDDEIAELAEGFKSMIHTIEDHIKNLDNKIELKTKELNQQRQEAQTILKSITLPVLISSKETRKILYANEFAQIQYGAPMDEIIGSNVQEIYSILGQEKHIIEALMTKGRIDNFEEVFKTKNGKEFTALLSVIPIMYHGEEAFIGTVADISKQKEIEKEIRKINQRIQDSIDYASLIQGSLIPDNKIFKKYFNDHFTIWDPKDTVGGDIYLVEELRHDNECLIMCIDCTGHGVPGAFVTMLVKAIERQIVTIINNNDSLEVSPAWILKHFNKTIKTLLKQEDKESVSNAGFDGGIIYFNKKENIIKFSGANTSLFFTKKNEMELNTIKGDRHSIGYKTSNENYKFTEHNISIEKDMRFYLTTDGYIDQNGGEKNFPLGKKRFKKIIEENLNKSFSEQQKILMENLAEYQKDEERNDDITVIGIRI
jgi:PAS domain S-box-containing protein